MDVIQFNAGLWHPWAVSNIDICTEPKNICNTIKFGNHRHKWQITAAKWIRMGWQNICKRQLSKTQCNSRHRWHISQHAAIWICMDLQKIFKARQSWDAIWDSNCYVQRRHFYHQRISWKQNDVCQQVKFDFLLGSVSFPFCHTMVNYTSFLRQLHYKSNHIRYTFIVETPLIIEPYNWLGEAHCWQLSTVHMNRFFPPSLTNSGTR